MSAVATREKQDAQIALLAQLVSLSGGTPSSGGGGTAGPTVDRELVVTTYVAKAASTGVAIGDTVTCVQVIDVSGAAPSTLRTIWRNQTAGADLAGPPAGASLTLLGKEALTDAQLRATALAVTGPLTDAQLRASAVPVAGPLTDEQLRAGAVPVSMTDGVNIALGARADAAWAGNGAGSVVAILKGLWGLLSGTLSVRRYQSAPAAAALNLAAATKKDILAPDATLTGARVLNWTASPVYLVHGTGADPAADAPSDYVPAAVSGVPGQWEAPFAPVAGLSAKGASAGNLTVVRY